MCEQGIEWTDNYYANDTMNYSDSVNMTPIMYRTSIWRTNFQLLPSFQTFKPESLTRQILNQGGFWTDCITQNFARWRAMKGELCLSILLSYPLKTQKHFLLYRSILVEEKLNEQLLRDMEII